MSGTNRSILLVEDNPMDVDLTLRAFARRKLTDQIHVVRDGEEAVACIAKWEAGEPRPVAILLDLKLPKLNGLEVLKRLKENPVSRVIPVVILTTSSDDNDIEKAYEYGANSYIVKPVNFEKFMQVAEQVELYWTVLNNPSPQ